MKSVLGLRIYGDTDTYRGNEPIEDIRNEFEILLGDTNRRESVEATATLQYGEYAYGVSEDGKTVYITWNGDIVVAMICIEDFMRNCIGYGVENNTAVEGGAKTPLTLGMSVKKKAVLPWEENMELKVNGQIYTSVEAAIEAIGALGDESVPALGEYPIGRLTVGGVGIADYAIVYDGTADGLKNAEELSRYIARATGVFVPVIPDTESAEHEIVLGVTARDTDGVRARRDALKNDGVMYYFEDGRLYISSHSKVGQSIAVYKFLEEQLGVRYYRADFEKILPAEYVDIPADIDHSYSPKLVYRNGFWGDTRKNERKIKLGLNGSIGVENTIVGFAHTMGKLAETEGTSFTNPCLTDEGIYQTVLKNLRKQLEENPGAKIVSVTQIDGLAYCECANCAAIAQKEGMSGLNLMFVNRLADDIKDEYPNVSILTFAYRYTRKPPVTVKARDNVIIWLCSIECCFAHTLDDPHCDLNAEFCRDIEGWRDYCPRVYVWDYTTNYHNYCMPFANFGTLRENLQFYIDNNVEGMFEQGGYQQDENGEFAFLRSYLIGQLLWNTDMTEDEYNSMLDEYLREYYGAGWRYVRLYIDYTCSVAATQHMTIYDSIGKYLPESADYAMLLSLWEKAIAAAEDGLTREHCRASSIQARLLPGNHDGSKTDVLELMKEFGIAYKAEGGKNIDTFKTNKDLGYSK